MIEMHPDPKLTPRDFRRIIPALHDCRDDDRVARLRRRIRGDDHAIANRDMRVGSEALVDRDSALRRLEEEGYYEERIDHALKLVVEYLLPVSC